MTYFFSSLPSAPTRIPRPHIRLKTDRKQFTVWYSGSIYPSYVWATHRLYTYYPKLFSEIQPRRHTTSRRFMKKSVRYFPVCTLSLSATIIVRNLTFLWTSFANTSGRTVAGVESVNDRLLGLRIWIPPGAHISRKCFVLSSRGLCDDHSSGGVLPNVVCTDFF
jgi:hypothetical protein